MYRLYLCTIYSYSWFVNFVYDLLDFIMVNNSFFAANTIFNVLVLRREMKYV
jgi:hypothetical protein